MGEKPRLLRVRLWSNEPLERIADRAEEIAGTLTYTILYLFMLPVRILANLDRVIRVLYRRLRGKPVCWGYGDGGMVYAFPDTIEDLEFPKDATMRCSEKRNGRWVWIVYEGPRVFKRGEEK